MINLNTDLTFIDASGQVRSTNGDLTLRASVSGVAKNVIIAGSNLNPETHGLIDLGRTDLRWRNIHAQSGTFISRPSVNGSGVILQGEEKDWVNIRLAADFSTISLTAVDVPGFNLVPAPNRTYEIRGIFMVRSPNASRTPLVGVAWPTGLTDGVLWMDGASTDSFAHHFTVGNISTPLLGEVGAITDVVNSWPVILKGMLITGPIVTGTLKIQLATENVSFNVTIKAGSFLSLRMIS